VISEERAALAALSAVAEPGRHKVMSRVAELGAQRTWQEIQGGSSVIDRSGRLGRLAADVDGVAVINRAVACGARFICPGDDEWPDALDDTWATLGLEDSVPPPLGLYVRGRAWLPDVTKRSVTLVGSRAASPYGERAAADLAADLAIDGWTVISGGAYGIDAAAHRGALAVGGTTIAVLACGTDIAYPRPHESLLRRISDSGLVISELPPGTTPTRSRFLDRNRLIAALGCGTVVVEAAKRSGALNTAGWAARLNRPLMAVPGPVTSALSVGCHDLLRQGNTLVTCAAEISDVVGTMGVDALEPRRGESRPTDSLAPEAKAVFEALNSRFARTAGELAETTGFAERIVEQALGELHEAGLAREGLAGWHLGEKCGSKGVATVRGGA
jgi:DNA processing protein